MITPADSLKMSPPIRVLEFKYLGPIDGRGSQVRITDRRFSRSVLIPYDYDYNSAGEQAWAHLAGEGWPLAAMCQELNLIVVAWDGSPHMLGGES